MQKDSREGSVRSQDGFGPSQAEIADGYREFAGEDVNLWHFPMMNDDVRNSAYEAALKKALHGGGVVLDIGTGSGLLAMLAVRHGASQVFTCEVNPQIARKAKEIIRQNGYADRIEVINKLSTDLIVGRDLPVRADILVTEIFDDGLLGEWAFSAIGHAQKSLLKPGAQIIPAGARVFAACLDSAEISGNHRVEKAAGFDVSAFNEFSTRNYIGYHLDKMEYRMLTDAQPVFTFDFNHIPDDQSRRLEFIVRETGICHCITYWYELQMDDVTRISTSPKLPRLSCWKQAVRVLESPRVLTAGETFVVNAHHDDETIWFTIQD